MTLAIPTNNDTARPVPRLEEQFQPILPKVDHILSLLRDHQVQLASQPPSSSTHGNKRAEGQADLEDMIIKEVRCSPMARTRCQLTACIILVTNI